VPVSLSSLITVPAHAVSAALSAGGRESGCLRRWLLLVPDPRKRVGWWHPLEFALALAMCAFTAARHDSPTAIALGNRKQGALRPFSRGPPWLLRDVVLGHLAERFRNTSARCGAYLSSLLTSPARVDLQQVHTLRGDGRKLIKDLPVQTATMS
jgi:hypothetical protein